MRYCRYDDDRIGVVRDDKVHDVTAILDELPAQRYPFPRGDAIVSRLPELRGKMEALADASEGQPISGVRLLSPVANPTKVIGTPVKAEGIGLLHRHFHCLREALNIQHSTHTDTLTPGFIQISRANTAQRRSNCFIAACYFFRPV